MAVGVLPEPGTKFGPCVPECSHRDCAQTRMIAASLCRMCDEAIGYEKGFFRDDAEGAKWIHAVCAEDEATK